MIFPEITDTHVIFPFGYDFKVNDLALTELSIPLKKVYEWIEAANSNHILCPEGEIIDLEPKEFIYSDLFINSTEKQHQLINYVINDLRWK